MCMICTIYTHEARGMRTNIDLDEELIERGLTVDIGKIEKTRAPKPRAARQPSARDLARVETLAAELASLEARQASEQAEIDRRMAELERERTALAGRHVKALGAVTAKLQAARAKLRP